MEAVVPNPGHRLLPGAFVTMKITNDTVADKLLVPRVRHRIIAGRAILRLDSDRRRGGVGTGQVYECVICHIHYTAAQAKKFH